jgi:hypothetical protein
MQRRRRRRRNKKREMKKKKKMMTMEHSQSPQEGLNCEKLMLEEYLRPSFLAQLHGPLVASPFLRL